MATHAESVAWTCTITENTFSGTCLYFFGKPGWSQSAKMQYVDIWALATTKMSCHTGFIFRILLAV
jgi:hypothetical protein